MGYDDVIPLLGGFGRYQRRIYFLLCLPSISSGFYLFSHVFLQAKPLFRCRLPNELANASYDLSSDHGAFDSCTMILEDDNEILCNDYVFDKSTYKSTTATEWNLVCDRSYLKTVGDSMLMFGVMIGAIVMGGLSDRYGRKSIYCIALVIQPVFFTLAAFAPEFWMYVICRTIVGAATSGYLVSYVISMEMVGPTSRLYAGIISTMFFSSGYILTAGFAYLVREWRYLHLLLALPGFVYVSYWWFIPESVRWLLSKGRLKEAIELIQIAAKENKVEISTSHLETLLIADIALQDDTNKATILDIFKYPNLRKCSLLMFFNWFITSNTYYGLSWNTNNLDGNDFINFLLSGAVEFPAYTFLLLTLNKWGRKMVLCGCMVTAGVALLSTSVVSKEPFWIMILLTMIGKFAITAVFSTIYIFTAEQFPTVIRNAGLGICSMCARIGSMLAPGIILANDVWKPLPMVIYGVLVLLGSGLSMQLPETLNTKLPETILESEQLSENVKTKNTAAT